MNSPALSELADRFSTVIGVREAQKCNSKAKTKQKAAMRYLKN